MDTLDREILTELRRNARISFRDLGARVGLSANATADRVRRLERDGVVTGYTALVDESAAGMRIVVLMDVRLRPGTPATTFENVVVRMPAVTDAEHMTGHFDYQLRVACRDVAELDALIATLKTKAGAIETSSRLALRVVVHRGAP